MKGSLFRKYATVLMLLVGIALIVGGAFELAFNYAETRQQVELRQDVEARAAAVRIREYLKGIESQIREVSGLPWASGALKAAERRDEFHRLLKLVPAITEIRSADATGRERLRVSRTDLDDLDSGRRLDASPVFIAARKSGIYYGPTYFKDGSEPYVTLGVRDNDADGWVTLAEVNLKFVGELIHDIRFGREGRAYVVDGENHLVAHPDIRHVLRKTNLAGLAPVRALSGATDGGANGDSRASSTGENLDHVRVLTSRAPVGVAQWSVFVEQPEDEAFAPVYASIVRTVFLFLLGIAFALAAAYFLAKRLSQPILAVQRGAVRLGSGDLQTRIDVNTGDEVEALANEFNLMAAELQELYTGLEQKVAEKTAQLEMANRHKSEFLANMSHELRTPLNAVIGFSEALKERMFGELNAKQLEYVSDIYASGQHLLSLINDILDLSKVEAGYMSLDIREFDLPAAVKNCCTLIRERAQRQRLNFECAVEPGIASWPGDERKFKQVLLNLLSNAVKFTPAGGSVLLRAKVEDGWLVVSVRDTGVGISLEDRAAIFKEFHQLRTSATAKHEGTGLGLALSRRLVELHCGTLTVESTPGQGSTFTARFPGNLRRIDHA
jgi:signal transduction histidine kinase